MRTEHCLSLFGGVSRVCVRVCNKNQQPNIFFHCFMVFKTPILRMSWRRVPTCVCVCVGGWCLCVIPFPASIWICVLCGWSGKLILCLLFEPPQKHTRTHQLLVMKFKSLPASLWLVQLFFPFDTHKQPDPYGIAICAKTTQREAHKLFYYQVRTSDTHTQSHSHSHSHYTYTRSKRVSGQAKDIFCSSKRKDPHYSIYTYIYIY